MEENQFNIANKPEEEESLELSKQSLHLGIEFDD